jgi:hypothetical protein
MTAEKIQPGDGWRLLGPDEVVKDGDERWRKSEKRWVLIPVDVPYTAKAYPAVRRRIPAKPEAMEIDHQTIKCNSFDEVMAKDDSGEVWRVVSNTEQARQLADWLTRYAEWREAQEAK